MCGAKTGGPSLEGVDLSRQAVIQGVVLNDEHAGRGRLRAAARRRW